MDPVRIVSNLSRRLLAGYPVFRQFLLNNLWPHTEACRNRGSVADDVDYAFQVAGNYLEQLAARRVSVRGARVLELGAGRNLGASLLLACHGARVVAVEPQPAPWDPDYHPRFLAALLERLADQGGSPDPAPLELTLGRNRVPEEAVRLVPSTLLQAGPLEPDSFDLVLSNAVLEHVSRIGETLAELARITRPGGLGFHQIDLRFHSLLSDPLRFLLYSEARYERIRRYTGGRCGSNLRLSQYLELFGKAGFQLLDQSVNLEADPDYLDGIRKKLGRKRNSPFRDWPARDLAVLSARVEVVKPGPAGRSAPAG